MKIKYHHEIKETDKVTPDEILNLILKHREIKNIKKFLDPPSPLSINIADFGPPTGGLKKEIQKTLTLLEEIKKNNQMVVVYTDYDADGITGGAILWETLHLLGFKIMPYVPHRKLEGYGFSIKGIDAVKKQFDPALIISVDHGITAAEKVTYAKKLGIPIIITDHHLKPEKLPTDALAIFHIPALSGSGVSYFFSKMIFDHFKSSIGKQTSNIQLLTSNFSNDYLALASIGTVADLVPLVGPSRSLVKYGLESFTNIKRVGLKQILKEAHIEDKKITPYEIGFIIAPRINAIGRLEHAIDALRLLCTNNNQKAHELASKIGEKNRERQDMVNVAVEEAKKIVENSKLVNSLTRNKLIILISNKWHEGIIGLIASKITERYYRPTIVMTQTDGFLKGSARSIPSFHITDFLRSLKEYLIDVGGHKGAAGFTIEKNKLKAFIEVAQKKAEKLISEKDLVRIIEADLKIPLSKVTIRLAKQLEKLQPFGIGNPQPSFYSEGELLDAKLIGSKSKHLKMYLKDKNSFPLEVLSFNDDKDFTKLSRGSNMKIIFKLSINYWNNKEQLQAILTTKLE